MRSHKTEQVNKTFCSIALICLMLVSTVMACSAGVFAASYGSPVTVKVPYTHIYDADKNRTDDSFTYRITPVDGAPAPEGSNNGAYDFTVKAVPGSEPVTGEIELKIAFPKPGEYKYSVSAYVPSQQKGFTYEGRTYTLHVYVQNDDNGGLGEPLVTATGASGQKLGRLQFNPGHESETLPPEDVRPTTTPTGDGTVPDDGVKTGNRNPANGGNGGNGGGNAGNGGNGGNAAPAAAGVTETPEPTEEIDDNQTPLADLINKSKEEAENWALLNLISAILSVVIAAVMLKRYFERIDTEEDEYVIRREGKLRLLGLIPAVVSVAAFLLTEDLSKPMAMADKWTPWMLIMLIISMLTAFVAYRKYNDNEGDTAQSA